MTTAQINKLVSTIVQHTEVYMLDNRGNHIVYTTNESEAYYAYSSLVAIKLRKPPYTVFLANNWRNSTSISKFRSMFLNNESTQDTLHKLQTTKYISLEIDNGKI